MLDWWGDVILQRIKVYKTVNTKKSKDYVSKYVL